MDELASMALDRINALAKKCLKEGDELSPEHRTSALVRITENVRLIKRCEKIALLPDEDDEVETPAPAQERKHRRSSAPSAT